MTFTKIKPSRRKAYLKATRSAGYSSHARDLLNTHPDWIRPSQPLIDKVLDRTGKPIEKHPYIPVIRQEPMHCIELGRSICNRYITSLWLRGGTYWLVEVDTLLGIGKTSLNYGSGELANTAYQMNNVSWK